jgi:hypothetical protein
MVLLAKILNDIVDNRKNTETEKSEKSIKLQSSKQNIDEKKLRAVSASKIKDDIVKLSIGMLLLYVLCGGIAAYFSWKHNSKIGWTTVYKVLFAIFAFFCPAEYVTIYFTYKSDLLTYMERTKTEFVAPVVVATPTSL